MERSNEPHDKLTRMAGKMVDTLEDHEDFDEGIHQTVVMVTDGKDNGIALGGFDNDIEAVAFMMETLRAIMEANGKKFEVMFMDENGVTKT